MLVTKVHLALIPNVQLKSKGKEKQERKDSRNQNAEEGKMYVCDEVFTL